jgi:hypothetical protein
MPEIIPTAEIARVETGAVENDDTYPGTYGFYLELTRDPGSEWFVEFSSAYDAAVYPGKPPIEFKGNRLLVFYLPRYAGDLPKFCAFSSGLSRRATARSRSGTVSCRTRKSRRPHSFKA